MMNFLNVKHLAKNYYEPLAVVTIGASVAYYSGNKAALISLFGYTVAKIIEISKNKFLNRTTQPATPVLNNNEIEQK